MDLYDFRVFLAIYKHGSISKAAASLYMNQSNLSSKIQKLEKEIGAELFVRGRGRHSIELTNQGEKFLLIAQQIENSIGQVNKLKYEGKKQFLSVASNDSTNLFTLVPFYKQFMKRHPDIALAIHTYHTTEIYNKLTQNQFDIGIVTFQKKQYDVQTKLIYKEPTFLITPRSSKYYNDIDAKDLPAEKEICIRWNDYYNAWHDEIWGKNNYYARVSNGTDLANYMDEEGMWSIVTLSIAFQLMETHPLSIYSLKEEPPKIHYYLAKKERKYQSEAVDIFLQELQDFINHNINIEPVID